MNPEKNTVLDHYVIPVLVDEAEEKLLPPDATQTISTYTDRLEIRCDYRYETEEAPEHEDPELAKCMDKTVVITRVNFWDIIRRDKISCMQCYYCSPKDMYFINIIYTGSSNLIPISDWESATTLMTNLRDWWLGAN